MWYKLIWRGFCWRCLVKNRNSIDVVWLTVSLPRLSNILRIDIFFILVYFFSARTGWPSCLQRRPSLFLSFCDISSWIDKGNDNWSGFPLPPLVSSVFYEPYSRFVLVKSTFVWGGLGSWLAMLYSDNIDVVCLWPLDFRADEKHFSEERSCVLFIS